MKRKLIMSISLFVFGCATLFSAGCGGGGNNQDPNRGFDVRVTAAGIQTGARVDGNFLSGAGTYGSVTSFSRSSINGVGFTQIPGAKVPGTWRLTYGPDFFGGSLCLGFVTVDRNVNLGSQETLPCPPRFFSFNASPDTLDSQAPPATVTLSGAGVENLYGTPMIAYYDEFGNVVASSSANQLLYDGGGNVIGVSASVPNLSQVYDGIYTVTVHNVDANGNWELVGGATMTIYGNPPPIYEPPPGGGCEPQPRDQEQLPCE